MHQEFKMHCAGLFHQPGPTFPHGFFSFRLELEDPACVAIRCAAHTFQLLMSDLSGTPILKNSMDVLGKITAETDKREVLIHCV